MIKKAEVQDLKEKVHYLEGIIEGVVSAWKLRHPEDFKPDNSKFVKYEGSK